MALPRLLNSPNDHNLSEADLYSHSSAQTSQEDFYQYANVSLPAGSARAHKAPTESDLGDSDAFSDDQKSFGSDRKSDNGYFAGRMCFLITALTSAILVTALEAFIFGLINVHRSSFYAQNRYLEMSIFLALFIFAGLYQIIIVFVSLRWENILLLAALCIFYACMLIYTGVQYYEVSSDIDLGSQTLWKTAAKATNITAICLLAVTLVVQSCIVFFVLRKNVKWFNFKKTGASFELKRLYSIFQLHRCLLVFDFFFFLGFTVQFIVIMVSNKGSLEFVLTCCMLPLTILVLVASDMAMCHELIPLSIFTMICFTGGCVYVLFKMIRLFTKYTSAYNVSVVPGHYFPGRTSLICFGCITLVVLFATVILEAIAIHGYKRGLLPFVESNYSFLIRKGKRVQEKEDESMLID